MWVLWIVGGLVFFVVVMPIVLYMWAYMAGKGFFSSMTKYYNKTKVNQNGKE